MPGRASRSAVFAFILAEATVWGPASREDSEINGASHASTLSGGERGIRLRSISWHTAVHPGVLVWPKRVLGLSVSTTTHTKEGSVASMQPSDPRALPAIGDVLVETRDLSKIFRVGDSRVVALNRVNLQIRRGTFTAVVGTSGSGKSTLLNMLGGLEKPTNGEIFVAGQPLHLFSESQLVTYRREQVGFIFQSFNLLDSMTALENVALPLSFRGISKQARLARARAVLMQLGLERHLNHRPSQLSGGQQQRVGIARAMAVRPTLVFADEPTGNLDSKTSEETLNLFRAVIRRFGQTWIMVTHDHHLASFADTIVSIGDGRITDISHTKHNLHHNVEYHGQGVHA